MKKTRTDETAVRVHHLWSLGEDVAVRWDDEGRALVLSGPLGIERVEDPAPVVAEALRRMELGPVLLANLETADADGAEGGDTYVVLLPVLRRLSHLVTRTLGLEDLRGPLLSVVPIGRTACFSLVRLPAQRAVHLPAGATITVAEAEFSVQPRGAQYRVVIHRPEAMWVVSLLAWPVTPQAVVEALPLPAEVTREILGYLAGAGAVVAVP